MARQGNYGYDANYSNSITGGYIPRPIRINTDVSLVRDVINTLNEQQSKTQDVADSVIQAFNSVELDPSESEYKKKLVDKYVSEIRANPFDTLNARKLANEAAMDQEFQGKMKAHNQHDEFKKRVEALRDNDKISPITAERLLSEPENQYKYNPIYDADGNIVGVKDWKAGKEPVARIDRTKLMQFAAQITAEKHNKAVTQRGSAVTNADGTGSASDKTYGKETQVKTKEDIREMFDAVFSQFPGAEESLRQDYEDDIYLYKKSKAELETTTDPSRIAVLNDTIKQIEDRLPNKMSTTPTEYMAKAMDVMAEKQAYNNIFTEDRTSSSVDRQASGSGGGGGGGFGALGGLMDKIREGYPIKPERAGTVYQNAASWLQGALGNAVGIANVYAFLGTLLNYGYRDANGNHYGPK